MGTVQGYTEQQIAVVQACVAQLAKAGLEPCAALAYAEVQHVLECKAQLSSKVTMQTAMDTHVAYTTEDGDITSSIAEQMYAIARALGHDVQQPQED